MTGAVWAVQPFTDRIHVLVECSAYGEHGFEPTIGVLDLTSRRGDRGLPLVRTLTAE